MKIVTVVGARPQFIKAATVSRAIKEFNEKNTSVISEIMIHTGQHFDDNMSDVFFRQLDLEKPKYNLDINCAGHSKMVGRMIIGIAEVLDKENPDLVLVYGDTNSTLAGAISAKKNGFKVAHVESGLRSYDMSMPEEINRVLTDRASDILFCPTVKAQQNLIAEGYSDISNNIFNCGDVMFDSALHFSHIAQKPAVSLNENFIVATFHRENNINCSEQFTNIIKSLNALSQKIQVIVPIHPRTYNKIIASNIEINFNLIDPVSYLEMIFLLKNCKLVITDSGGLQKEAFYFSKPSFILRQETEWIELVEGSYSTLVGSDVNNIIDSVCNKLFEDDYQDYDKRIYGDGKASNQIVKILYDIYN